MNWFLFQSYALFKIWLGLQNMINSAHPCEKSYEDSNEDPMGDAIDVLPPRNRFLFIISKFVLRIE